MSAQIIDFPRKSEDPYRAEIEAIKAEREAIDAIDTWLARAGIFNDRMVIRTHARFKIYLKRENTVEEARDLAIQFAKDQINLTPKRRV